jgi:hypothetical protein
MKPHINSVAKSLVAILKLSREMQAEILHKLVADGHVAGGDSLYASAAGSDESEGAMEQISATGFVKLQTPIEAASDPQKLALLRSVVAQCRALQVSFDPEKQISMMDLDKQLAGKDVTARLKLKQSMAMLGLIA